MVLKDLDFLGLAYELGIGSPSLRVGTDKNQRLFNKEEWGKRFWLDNQLYLHIREHIGSPLRLVDSLIVTSELFPVETLSLISFEPCRVQVVMGQL